MAAALSFLRLRSRSRAVAVAVAGAMVKSMVEPMVKPMVKPNVNGISMFSSRSRLQGGSFITSAPFRKAQAKDIIYRLSAEERVTLLKELQALQAQLHQTSAADSTPPTSAQLRAVVLHNALPFIGFGFLDNFIMVVAGDYIDMTIGVTLGISTLAAAALGNMISDIAGVGSAWYVEILVGRFGVMPPPLTILQLGMVSTRWSAHFGRAIGVTIGCILGMVPLLFLPSHSKRGAKDGSEASKPDPVL